jgi:hypothetical protein
MKRVLFSSALVLAIGSAHAHESEQAKSAEPLKERGSTVEFTSPSGRPLGSVTRIGGVTYFAGADGRLLGTVETIDGRKVYKSY